jgi:hypothetical protein
MINAPDPHAKTRRTPEDATEFEREQLRFLLSDGDPAATLTEINPSLAWLPVLWSMSLIHPNTQLVAWIERNFEDENAVRDVVANLRFFRPETATILESRLNAQIDRLSPLLAKCWHLIIRQMKAFRHGVLENDWYEVVPRMKRGDASPDTMERVAEALRPKLTLDKRTFYNEDDDFRPERPSDLMSVKYEVADGLTGHEVLGAWPESASAEADYRLLSGLFIALKAALDDASDVGVEGPGAYGITDHDVPSVARHEQNNHQSGFYPIVRVMADLWDRLARKSPSLGRDFFEAWAASGFRLIRRLALYAATSPVISAEQACNLLTKLPQPELFFTGSTVEMFRLIRSRWYDFTLEMQTALLHRFAAGPPQDWFQDGTDIDQRIDRCRFDALAEMERDGFVLTAEADLVLTAVRARWPAWELRPSKQAGFHTWMSSGETVVGNAATLNGVADDALVAVAEKIAANAEFFESDVWNALCQADPDRALRGLALASSKDHWSVDFWRQLLWVRRSYQQTTTAPLIAHLLLKWPKDSFEKIVEPASAWIDEQVKTLDEALLWPLWDRIADATLLDTDGRPAMNDIFTNALNSAAGRLSGVLIRKMPGKIGDDAVPSVLRQRLDRMASSPGHAGRLARVRLAAEVSMLFQRAPLWTAERIVPLFDWSSSEAADVWSARKYSNYVGSPELFELTKDAFLEIFSRPTTPDDNLRIFSEWLTAILIANQSKKAAYPITPTEARVALRRAGIRALSSVGRRLTTELTGGTSAERAERWRAVVGPVFTAMWPLDVELQTSATTYTLVQLLRNTGDAFPEAADIIIPFIRPEDGRSYSTVFAIAEADDAIYAAAPAKVVDLLVVIVGDGSLGSVYGLDKAMNRILKHGPELGNTRKFQKLLSVAS